MSTRAQEKKILSMKCYERTSKRKFKGLHNKLINALVNKIETLQTMSPVKNMGAYWASATSMMI